MRIIHKTALAVVDEQKIVRSDGRIVALLSVGEQSGQLCVWYEIELNDSDSSAVDVQVVGTGNPRPAARHYVGTVTVGVLVRHIYHGGIEITATRPVELSNTEWCAARAVEGVCELARGHRGLHAIWDAYGDIVEQWP